MVAECECGRAWKGRNIAHRIVWSQFPDHEWICRLDSDDRYVSDDVIETILDEIEKNHPEAYWALSGNRQIKDGTLLDYINRPSLDLFDTEVLLERLKGMMELDPSSELPSCNLWIRNGMRCP